MNTISIQEVKELVKAAPVYNFDLIIKDLSTYKDNGAVNLPGKAAKLASTAIFWAKIGTGKHQSWQDAEIATREIAQEALDCLLKSQN